MPVSAAVLRAVSNAVADVVVVTVPLKLVEVWLAVDCERAVVVAL